jgi:hypothetical protein
MSTPTTGTWIVAGGSPKIESAAFLSANGSACSVYADIGIGDDFNIRFSLNAPPTIAGTIDLAFCVALDLSTSYTLKFHSGSRLELQLPNGTVLDSYNVAPAAGDQISVWVVEGGDVTVYVNDVVALTTDDQTQRGATNVLLTVQNTGAFGIYTETGTFEVVQL